MQTLWSRVAQAQSTCRCRVCLQPANALARRSTTAASRRRVTGADLFTACYTTILGTAVVIDSKRKDARRKELDDKLEKARASMSSLAVQEAAFLPEEYGAPISTSDEKTNIQIPSGTKAEPTDFLGLLDELTHTASETYVPRQRSSWPKHEVDWVQVEAAITAEEKDDTVVLRHPKDQGQLEKTTRQIESLVQTLLWRARNPACPDAPSDSTTAGTNFLEEAEKLMGSYPSYSSPHIEPVAASDARLHLNETFRNIFNKATDAQETVGKICYNLLVSSSPPNIHNYNALIAGFNRIQRPDLAQAVVDSYLNRSKWPPTQQTLVCLLSHASINQNIGLFREIVGRMRGVIEDGMHIRIFHKDAIWNEAGEKWAREKAAFRKNSYVERAHREQHVFNSLIRGWLRLGNIQAACMSFVACVRHDYIVPTDTIYELLTECLLSLNQINVNTMFNRLTKDLEQFAKLLDHIATESTEHMAQRIAGLLSALADLRQFSYRPFVGNVQEDWRQMLQSFSGYFKADNLKTNNDLRPVIRVAGLHKKVQDLEEKAMLMDAHVKAATIRIMTGYDVGASARLPRPGWKIPAYQHFDSALLRALQAIDLTSDISTINDVKAQLLDKLPDQTLAPKLRAAADLDRLNFRSLVSFYHPLNKSARSHTTEAGHNIGRIAGQAAEIKDNIRTILFCYLTTSKQQAYRTLYPDWYKMPVQRLLKHSCHVLARQVRAQQKVKASASLLISGQVEEEELDSSDEGQQQTLSGASEASSTQTDTEIPIPVAKLETPVMPLSAQQLWSDEHVRYQPLRANCSCNH